MIHTSALGPVSRAVVARIETYTLLAAVLAGEKVYARIAPETIIVAGKEIATPFPYIVLGDRAENDFDTFGTPGSEGEVALHLWSAVIGNDELDALYALLKYALSAPLALDTGVMLSGRLRYVTDNVDTSGAAPVMHAVTRYTTLARVPA